MNTGGTLLNIFLVTFRLVAMPDLHIASGIAQCVTIIGIPVGIANFEIAAIALCGLSVAASSVRKQLAPRQLTRRRF